MLGWVEKASASSFGGLFLVFTFSVAVLHSYDTRNMKYIILRSRRFFFSKATAVRTQQQHINNISCVARSTPYETDTSVFLVSCMLTTKNRRGPRRCSTTVRPRSDRPRLAWGPYDPVYVLVVGGRGKRPWYSSKYHDMDGHSLLCLFFKQLCTRIIRRLSMTDLCIEQYCCTPVQQ